MAIPTTVSKVSRVNATIVSISEYAGAVRGMCRRKKCKIILAFQSRATGGSLLMSEIRLQTPAHTGVSGCHMTGLPSSKIRVLVARLGHASGAEKAA